MSLKPLDLSTAGKILDFSGGHPDLINLGKMQLEGAVAIHNMIANPAIGMGYLADEVGMGKTYIALGVVALMRYFNPSLRVLYICPSANVQDKWYSREYRSFTKHNVKVNQYRIRTLDGKPAAPRVNCRNVPQLIHTASLGYFADFFVGMGAFSLALNDDEEQWQKKLDELHTLLPAYNWSGSINSKMSVKEQYARALNYVLPTFDLLVIDEAHNFKHDFNSSDRNRVLSAVLGFRGDGQFTQRVKHALLLSATPYDRNLNQLRNQLKLVGKGHLLPEDIANDERKRTQAHLSRFLVRRLNELQIAGKPHTRNMYRREWRSGERAEISLKSDEQKLVTALVQKKVGEMLDKKGSSPSFQMGLLASFESYAESTKSEPVEFDGDRSEKDSSDAEDRHVIGAISDGYIRAELGTTLPHPKMDAVTANLAENFLERGKKQIAFVRRVKSVKELKNKLDDHYNNWIFNYIQNQLRDAPHALSVMEAVIAEYRKQSRYKDEDISGGEYQVVNAGESEDRQPPKNDTLFAWFFRGQPPETTVDLLAADADSYTTPEAMCIGLAAKNQVISSLLEINWPSVVCRYLGEDLDAICQNHGLEIARLAQEYTVGTTQNDQLELFFASQLGFLDWYSTHRKQPNIKQLIDHLRPSSPRKREVEISVQRLTDSLNTYTFYDAIEKAGLIEQLFPLLSKVLEAVVQGKKTDVELLQTMDIHRFLISLCLRTGHGVIDLYLARLRQGPANLTAETRTSWMNDLANHLHDQSKTKGFSTYLELHGLASQLNLVIKTNLPDAYDKSIDEYRKYFSQMLNPVAPVIGATGETYASRSAQARKFRMPGYPLALISTDVFQEGEDLHTFCDSVTHYGLSGSPVGIEQKTGRVDRVGSQAQRWLLQLKDESQINDDQFIQVTFPFVKQSIEVLQVRQLCHNINAFIESLHEVAPQRVNVQDIINTEEALRDRSAIPEQIKTRLQSPYVPMVANKSQYNREQYVAKQAQHTQRIMDHVDNLLNDYFGRRVLGEEGIHLTSSNGTDRPIAVSLRSARASGEMLLCAATKDTELTLNGMSRKQFLKLMREQSWQTFHRTYALETAKRCFQLHHDAEMLIGDEHATTPGEIQRFFERFTYNHDPGDYQKPSSDQIRRYWKRAALEQSAHFGQWKANVSSFEREDCLGLTFSFGDRSWNRKHQILIYEAEGRCIFMAQAANANIVNQLSNDQLLKLTWQRNAHIDIVEFMLDGEGNLVGRAVHPVDGSTFKRFLYCAYTLNVSTDRLEYLIEESDVY